MTFRLLIADDNVSTQKMIRLAFAGEDAVVESVLSGDAAIKALKRFRPNVVLADVVMPGCSGYEVCEFVRNDPQLASIPVILISGAFDPFDEDEAARVGASGHLTKPFNPSEMIAMVEKLLSETAHRDAPGFSNNAAGEADANTGAAAEISAPPTVSAAHDTQYDFFNIAPLDHSEVTAIVEKLLSGNAHHEAHGSSKATSESPELCVALPRQNAHLPNVNSAFVSVASLDFGACGGRPNNADGKADTGAAAAVKIPAPPAESAAPDAPPRVFFDVTPRSRESYLGPDRILEFFDDETFYEKAAEEWRIPEELIDRVAEKVAEKMFPDIETFIKQTLSACKSIPAQ